MKKTHFMLSTLLLAGFLILTACGDDDPKSPGSDTPAIEPQTEPQEPQEEQKVTLSCPCVYTKPIPLTFGPLPPVAGSKLEEDIAVSAQATAATAEEAKAQALEQAKTKAPQLCVEKHPGGTVDVSQCVEQQS